jgi:hypothetical protein
MPKLAEKLIDSLERLGINLRVYELPQFDDFTLVLVLKGARYLLGHFL